MVSREYDSNEYGGRPTVVDTAWLFITARDHRPMIKRVGAGERIESRLNPTTSPIIYKDVGGASFATPYQGWVIVGDGNLLSTTDGGATWTDITPGPKQHVIQLHD